MRNKRGLTIIEVIVVILIIFFLFATLLPKVNRHPHIANTVLCRNYLRQLGLTYALYLEDNNNKFLDITNYSNQGKWIAGLEPYQPRIKEIIKCPVAKKPRVEGTEYGGPNSSYLVSFEKEGSKKISIEGSYGINSWVYNPAPDSNMVTQYSADNFWRTNLIQKPYEVPLFTEAMWIGGFPEPNGIAGQPPIENGEWDSIDAAMKHFCIDRHSGAINIVFMDGHVEEVGLKDLWKLKWHKNFDTSGPWTKPDASWPDWMKSLK